MSIQDVRVYAYTYEYKYYVLSLFICYVAIQYIWQDNLEEKLTNLLEIH